MAADDYYTTRLLYLEDSYIKEFDAVVVKSGPRYVILDQTAFYPEGGGQPSDTGVFRYLKHEAQVVKVKKRGKDIYHHLNVDIPVGTRVHGIVNWEPRFENMRRHSGEHLLTGLFTAAGSGPKIYSDLYKLEFRPSELSNEDVRKVENLFNSIVEADLPLIIYDINRKKVEGEKDHTEERHAEFDPEFQPDEAGLLVVGKGETCLHGPLNKPGQENRIHKKDEHTGHEDDHHVIKD